MVISQGATGLYLAKIEVDLTLSAIQFLSYTLVYYMFLEYEMPYWSSPVLRPQEHFFGEKKKVQLIKTSSPLPPPPPPRVCD